MSIKDRKWRVYLIAVVGILLFNSACSSLNMQTAQPQQGQIIYPTIVVTRYVTRVPATPVPQDQQEQPAPTQQVVPTQASSPTYISGGWDPLAQPIYYPKIGCSASRLHIGHRAFAAYGADRVGLHWSEDIGDAPMYRHLYPGEILEIIDGPYCQEDHVIWLVKALIDEQVGYVKEGDGEYYYLLPLPATEEGLALATKAAALKQPQIYIQLKHPGKCQ